METFCKEIPVKHAYGQIFMEHFNKHLLKSQTVRFVLEWEADKKTVSDIQSVLRKVFHEHASQVKVKVVTDGSSIVVICYAPLHLHEVLTQLVKQNGEELLEEDVISITIGGWVVLKRDTEKEMLKEKLLSLQKENELLQDELTYRNIESLDRVKNEEEVQKNEEPINQQQNQEPMQDQEVEQLRLQVKRSKGMSAELDDLKHKLSEQYKVHNTAIALYSKSRTLADKRLLETKELKETTSALTMQLEQRDVEIRQLKEEIMKLSTSSLTLLLEYRDEEITLLKKEIKKLQESFEGMAYRKPKSSHILVPHHNEICEILSTTDTILLPFTARLFGKQVIDRSTKNEISQKAGYKAADILLDCLEMRVDRNPRLLQTVLEVMREVDALTHVAEKMEKERSAKQEDIPVLTDPSMIVKLDPIVEAGNLKQDFEELLVAILDAVGGVDLDHLKLRISWFFNTEGFITADVQAILHQLQSLASPRDVLNFLITRNFIGYLNYELTKAFQKAVKSEQLKAKIEEYEQKHDAFLHHFSFNAIIEAFRQHPDLAPVSVIGLPKFAVRLETPWKGRSVYNWKDVLLNGLPAPHLNVISIARETF